MAAHLLQYSLGAGSGALVGFSLGLVGGGGSILATPLLIYAVGLRDPHLAIGTSALSVSASACSNLINHARSGRVKWACASLFAAAGVGGALLGSSIGKMMNGRHLLVLFSLLMMVVAVMMVRRRAVQGSSAVVLCRANAGRLVVAGGLAGGLAGFFGIGGGFLIVPSLIWATGMPLLNAIGSSLIAVTIFGLTTALNYALAGWVDWPLAATFLVGGVAGGALGGRLANSLADRREALAITFSIILFGVALYVLYRSL